MDSYRARLHILGIIALIVLVASCCPAWCQTDTGEEEVILFDPAKVSPELLEPVGPEALKEMERAWAKGNEQYHQPPMDPDEATTGHTIIREPLRRRARGKAIERLLILFRWTGREETDQGVGKVACTRGRLRIELGSLVYLRAGTRAAFFDRESRQGCQVSGPQSRAIASKLEEYFQFFPHLISKKEGFDDIYSDFTSSRYVVKSLPPDDAPIYGAFMVSYPAGRVESLAIIERAAAAELCRLTFLSWNVNLPLPEGLFRPPGGDTVWDDLPVEAVPIFLR